MKVLNCTALSIFFFLVLTTTACLRNNEKSINSATQINVNLSFDPINISSVFSNPELLMLEKSDIPLGKISKVKIYNDTIYILSNFKVFTYSSDGKFIRVLNKQGRGPEEYINLFDFVVDEVGNIDILDFNGKKIIKYNAKGKYIDDWKTGMYAFSLMKIKDSYVIFGGTGNPATDYSEKMLYIFNKWKGRVIEKFIPVDHNMENFANYVDSRNIQSTNDGFYLGFSPYDTIYHYTDGQLLPLIIINFGTKKVSSEAYSTQFNDILAFNEYLNDNELCHFIHNYLVSPQLIMFNFFYKNVYWSGVYKPDSKEIIASNIFEDDLIFKGSKYKTSSFFPVEFYNGSYYFMIEPYQIVGYINDKGFENIGKTNLDQEKFKNIKIEDNPVLLKLKIKND